MKDRLRAGLGPFTAIPDCPQPTTPSSSFSKGHIVLNNGMAPLQILVVTPESLKSAESSLHWLLASSGVH